MCLYLWATTKKKNKNKNKSKQTSLSFFYKLGLTKLFYCLFHEIQKYTQHSTSQYCLAGFDEHLKDRYRNAVRRVQPANVQEVTADAMQNLSRWLIMRWL